MHTVPACPLAKDRVNFYPLLSQKFWQTRHDISRLLRRDNNSMITFWNLSEKEWKIGHWLEKEEKWRKKGKDENNSRQRARQTDSHRVFCPVWQISIITVQAFRVMKICTGRDFRNIGDQALSKIFWMHFLGEKQFLDCMKCVLIHTNKQMSYWYPPLTVLSSFSNCFMPRQSNNVIHVTLNFPSGGQSQIKTAGIWCDLTELLFIKTLIWHHPVSWQW